MAPRSSLANYDRAADGQLIPALRAWRREGLSWSSCSAQIGTEFGISVDPTTVRRWFLDLPEEAAAS